MDETIREQLAEAIRIKQTISDELAPAIAEAARLWLDTLNSGGLIAFCGNGGSAADAQHLAGELVSRFRRERAAYRAVALTTDTSILTAIGNDYGFENVFARQVEAVMRPGDLLVTISTSGSSPDCLLAVQQAHSSGITTWAMTGASGGLLGSLVDYCLCVPSQDTPRVQEAHITIGHIICDLVEAELSRDDTA